MSLDWGGGGGWAAGSGQLWFIFVLEMSEFAERIHMKYEGKGAIKDDNRVFGWNDWRNGAAIY